MKRLLWLCCFLSLTLSLPAQVWQHCNLPTPYNTGYYLDAFFMPTNPQYGWVCGFNGYVLRTTDGGTNWQGTVVPYNGSQQGHLESIQFVTTQIGYCSGPCGVFKSVDGGASWANITPTIPNAQNPWGLSFLNANWGVLVAGGCGTSQYFLLTTDGGQNWTLSSTSVPQSGMTDVILYPNGNGMAVGSGSLYRSLDSGRTWSPFQSTWSNFWDEELSISGFSVLVPWAGNTCSGAGVGGGGRMSVDFGANWKNFPTNIPMYGAYLLSPGQGWICGNNRNMWRTLDSGDTWELKNCGIDSDLDDCWFINDTTGFVTGTGVYKLVPPERSLSKSPIDFGSFCYPDVRYDTIWVRNKSYNGIGGSWTLSGADVQHFSVLAPTTTSFGIPSCDSAMFVVRFQPRSVGNKSVTLDITLNNGQHLTTTLSGSSRNAATAPVDTLITVNPAQCGTPIRVLTQWTNTGSLSDQVIQVQRISGATFTLENSLPIIIPSGGGTVGFTIVCPDTGWQIGRVRIRIGPCVHDTTFTLRVYGVSPIINTPLQRNYSSTCFAPVLDSIPVTNTGNADLIVSNNYIASGSSDFVILGWSTGESLPVSIKPGKTKYLLIRFTPLSSGPKSAVLRFTNNDQTTTRGNRSLMDVQLQGPSSGVSDSLSVQKIDFGKLCPGTSQVRTLTLYNTGSADITVLEPPPLQTPFSAVSSVTLPAVLKAHDSLRFTITFQAQKVGVFNDSLVLSIQPCDSARIAIPIHGECVSMLLRTVPKSIDTTMTVGSVAQFSIQVWSDGSDEVLIDAIALNPALPELSIIKQPTLPVRVSPGSFVTVEVEARPTTAGVLHSSLVCSSSGLCPASVTTDITINASQTLVSISKSRIDFPDQRCSSVVAYDTVYVRNDGGSDDSLLVVNLDAKGSTVFTLLEPKTLPLVVHKGSPIPIVVRAEHLSESIDTADLSIQFTTSYNAQPVHIPLHSSFRKTQSVAIDTVIDFGVLESCDLLRSKTIRFWNDGLLIDTLKCSTQLNAALRLSVTQIVLTSRGSDSVTIGFDPKGLSAQKIDQMMVWHSVVCGQDISVRVRAQIVAPHLQVSPTKLDFGTVWKGASKTLVIDVANHSDAARRLVGVRLANQSSQDITLSGSLDTLLQVGDVVSISARFTATVVGPFSADIVLLERSVCEDSTRVTCTALVPKELYTAELDVENGVIVDVADTADMWVVLRTNDTSDQALYKALPRSLMIRLTFNHSVMNVLSLHRQRKELGEAVPFIKTPQYLLLQISDDGSHSLGKSDTLCFIRAQGMQSIPNYTMVHIDSAWMDLPQPKDYVLNYDDGDFSVQACVKWARIQVAEVMTALVKRQPADEVLPIDLLNCPGGKVEVRFHSSDGRLLQQEEHVFTAGKAHMELSTATLSTGYYLIEIRSDDGQFLRLPVLIMH